MMEKYNVSVISGVNEVETLEFEKKSPVGRQVLVKVEYCAICTLEQRVFSGVMKRYPFAGGHEISGIIESAGDDVTSVKPGDKVAVRMLNSCGECYYCKSGHENQCVVSFKASVHEGLLGPGGFSEYMLLDAINVYKMAEDVDLAHAALAEPLACCVHSINNAQINLGDDVVVVGVGIMGAFHIQLAKLKGARVIACEIDEGRLEVARKMGADILINSGKEDAVARVKELTDGRGADAVFCTVASTSLASDSIEMTGKLGRAVMYTSFHPDNPVEISVNKIHSSEMIITGAVNPKMSDFLIASRLISNKTIDLSELISETVSLGSISKGFKTALKPDSYRVLVTGK
ncbi:MAG: alcohol dehydrogenase catalytic domain-containing protein [Spirochaetales bacterium]|nr:alcohol dehydrogenase catalytic domain-containing protein [Spirochaetales bacterium]